MRTRLAGNIASMEKKGSTQKVWAVKPVQTAIGQVNGRMDLKWFLKKQEGRLWAGFI